MRKGSASTQSPAAGGATLSPPVLDTADEPDRACIQLYDLVAGAVPLAGCDLLEVGCDEGRGTFGTPVECAAGAAPGEIAIGDLDGDGGPDLAVEDAGRGSIALGDLNGDGKPDLVGVFNGWIVTLANTSP